MDTNIILSILNLLVLAATLIFIAIQAKASRLSLTEIKKTILQNSVTLDNESTRDVYKLFINNPEFAEEYGYDKIDPFNLLIILHFESRFILRQKKFIEDSEWNADINQMIKTLNREIVKKSWDKDKDEFDEDFRKFIDTEILKTE